MQPFNYEAPTTVARAISLLQQGKGHARVLAGGTDLLVQVREGRRFVNLLVDVKGIAELNELSTAGGLTVGASVPCYLLSRNKQVAATYPGLLDATGIVGGMQIQGRASVGGNLCNASPAADTIPALIALGAVCVIAGPGGTREVPVENFCTGPGLTCLDSSELLIALRVPAPKPRSGAHYLRFTPRNEMDIAVTGAGAQVILAEDRKTIRSARVGLGAVAPTPLLVDEIGRALSDREISEEVFNDAAEIARSAAQPITDMRGSADQRKHLAAVLTRRALEGAIRRALES